MDYRTKTREELIDALLKLEKVNAALTVDREVKALALEKTEDRYKFLIENINDIIYEYDQHGILKYISPVVEKTFGFTPEDVIGKNFIHFVGGSEEFMQKTLESLREKKEINTEYEIPTKDGSIRWANLSTKAVFEGAEFVGGAGTVTDITERKRIETERNRNELLYQSILNATPDTITITDLTGKILFSSPSANKMFGYEAAFDFTNHSNFDFIDILSLKKAEDDISGMFRSEFNGAEEYIGIKADGSKFEIEVNGEFIRDANGQPVNMIFVTRDISQRKRTEEKLNKAKESYRNLIENINDVVYEVDNHGIINFMSPSIKKLLGYLPEEVIGQSFLNFVGENKEFLSNRLFELSEKNEIEYEYKLYSKTGELRWVRLSTKAKLENGLFIGGSGTLVDITEKKRIELELQKSEALYRSFLTASPDAITISDMKGRILFASPMNYKLFGYDPSYSFIDHFAFEYGSEKDRKKAAEALASETLESIPGVKEYTGIRSDGSTFDIEVNIEFIRDDKGQPVNMLFISRDITNRKLLESELRTSEEKYRHLVENINEIIYEIDAQGIVKYVSPAIQKLGYLPEEMIGQSFLNFTGKHADTLYQNLLRIGEAGEISNEYEMFSKSGEAHWLRISTKAIFQQGELSGGSGTLVDVTERKLIELALQKSEEKYRTMVERVNDVLFDVTIEGVIKYVSPAIEKVLGYTAEELIGKNFFSYMYPEDRPALIKALNNLSNRDSSDLEYRYYMKDGTLRWVRSSTRPIFEDGKMVGGIGVLIDIHQRKLAEERLSHSELRYKTFFEGNNSIMILVDPDSGSIKDANPAACQFYGWTHTELCRMNISQINILSKDGVADEMKLAKKEERRQFFFRHLLANGEIRDVEVYSGPMKFGRSTLLYSIVHDITKRKQAEENILKANRLRSFISNINLAIIKEKNKEKLLAKVCNIAVISGKFQMAWIGLIDEESKKVIPYIVDGQEDNYLSTMNQISVENVAAGKGPTGNALREGKPFICNDIEHDPAMYLWKNEALKRNYHSSIALPLRQFGSVFGAITLYSSLVNFFNTEEVELLVEVIDNICNAIEAIETEKERKRAEDELRKLSRAVEQSPVSIVITNTDGDIEYANPKARETAGYSMEELLGKNPRVLQSGETSKGEYTTLWETISSGKEWNGIFHNKKKTGELYWESSIIAPVLDETGKITHYVAIKEDITLKKALEEDLVLREADLNYAQSIVNMGSWELNFTTGNLKWSENNYRLLGLDPFQTEIHIDTYDNLVHPDDLQLLHDKMKEIVEVGTSSTFDLRLAMPDGKIKWLENYIVPVFKGDVLIGIKGVNIDITKKKQTEDKLKNQNERLNAIMQAMPDMIFILEKKENNLKYYTTNQDRLYVSDDDSVDSGLNDLFDADIHQLYLNKVEECLWRQNLVVYDYSMPTGDVMSYFEARLVPLDSNRVLSFVRDITGRKQDEKQIQKLLLAVTQSPVSVVVTDIDGNMEFVNPAFEETTGYSFDEVRGKNTRILKSGKNDESIYPELWNTIKGGSVWEKDWINRKKNGEYYWEHIAISPIHNEDGHIMNFLAIKQDITQRKQDEQEIRNLNINLEKRISERTSELAATNKNLIKEIDDRKRSEQKFATAFHSSSALMAISYFYNGQFVDVNNTFIETLGFSREEMIGKTNKELRLFEDKNQRTEILNSLEMNIPVRKVEVLIRTKFGQLRTILLSADTIYLGEKRCLLTVSVDITDRKSAEAEIKKARMEAEQANIAKSEFLSRMSHELRTPMNSILGFAQLLDMGELNTAQKRGVNHILHSGKHLLNLINEVLDISRIEAGRLSISIEPIKVNSIMEEMIDVLRPLAIERNINIELIPSTENDLFVKFDRQSLKQVILNLLNNAIKYNKPGGAVRIRTELMTENNKGVAYVRISISDTGIGISQEDISRLFTPFERIGADKTEIEGTGLGLAVVKKLIDAMGGFLGVKSRKGEGSTFWIELPKAESQLENHYKSALLEDVNSDLSNKRGTILYIEDNVSNIELVEQILKTKRPGVNLISNMNGKQAAGLAIEYMPDLILLDLNLPDIHGREVLRLLLGNDKTKDIPVIVISADAMHKQVETLIQAGARKYLTKPLDVVTFLKIIDEYIQG